MTNECPSMPTSWALAFDGPFSFVVILGGIFGNVYSLILLFSRSINISMLVSLTGLALLDIITLLAGMWHHSLWATLYYFSFRDEPWDKHKVLPNVLMEWWHITSTWMLIHVTLERFFAVARPFRVGSVHRKQSRKSFVRVVGGEGIYGWCRIFKKFVVLIRSQLILTLFACLICVPCTFEYTLARCTYKGREYQQMLETELMSNKLYKMLYRTIILSIVKTLIPFIVITCLTISTLKSMRQSMDSRASILITQGQNDQIQADKDKIKILEAISIMLLGKFVLFLCIPTATNALETIFGYTEDFVLPIYLSHFFLLFNSATNSVLLVAVKSVFETRRLKRIRQRRRQLVARTSDVHRNNFGWR